MALVRIKKPCGGPENTRFKKSEKIRTEIPMKPKLITKAVNTLIKIKTNPAGPGRSTYSGTFGFSKGGWSIK
jgi:hypothetical protein